MISFVNIKLDGFLLRAGLILALVCVAAYGDVKKRPPTSEEKEYYVKVLRALNAALPEGPAGWQIEEETEIKPLKRVYVGQERIPFPVQFSKTWIDPLARKQSKKSRDREEALLEETRALADQADYMTNIDALTALMKEANDRGDKQQTQTLQNQINRLLNEKDPYRTKVKESMERMKEELASNFASLQVTLEANRFVQVVDRAEPVPLSSHPDLTFYRTEARFVDDGEWQEGNSLVFLGKGWQRFEGEEGVMQAVMPVGVLHTAVYALVISVQGEERRAQQFLEKINWSILSDLLIP